MEKIKIDWNEVARAYQRGVLQKDIAIELNISQSYVSKKIREMGVDRIKKTDRVDWVRVNEMYKTGKYTLKDLSEIYSLSIPTIWTNLNSDTKKPTLDWEELGKLYIGGETQVSLAKRFKVSQAFISYNLNKRGYKQLSIAEKVNWPDVYKLYQTEKYSYTDFAEALSISKTSVVNQIKKIKKDRKKGLFEEFSEEFYKELEERLDSIQNRERKEVDWDRIAYLYKEDNLSQEKLSQIFNISQSVISIKMNEMGIKKDNTGVDWDEIASLYAKGLYTQVELAELYNVSRSSISNHMRQRGIDLAVDINWNEVVDLYVSGFYTQDELAKMYGVSNSHICLNLKRMNAVKPETDWDKIADLYNSGISQSEIANICGVSQSAISIKMKEMKIKPEIWRDRQATIYIIEAKGNYGEKFIKIGVTEANPERRVSDISLETPYICKVLFSEETNLYDAYFLEEEIIEEYSRHKYIPEKIFCGYTECFNTRAYEFIKSEISSRIFNNVYYGNVA